jgi:hypothetical protein
MIALHLPSVHRANHSVVTTQMDNCGQDLAVPGVYAWSHDSHSCPHLRDLYACARAPVTSTYSNSS